MSKSISIRELKAEESEWKDLIHLREAILRQPPALPFSPEELEEEKKHFHFGLYEADHLSGTAALVQEGKQYKMQRVAIRADRQSQGLGTALMNYCESWILNRGGNRVYCHARDSAINFYLQQGFQSEGDYFDEDQIPHLKMSKLLSS
tara:strand:+ start:8882 stop:9325 length:444 start_codon:yes stop_codon:yes gene_type:complete